MTDPNILFPWASPDGVEVLVAWLTPIAEAHGGACGSERQPGDPLPYWLVSRLAGGDDKITDHGTYTVTSLAETLTGAADWAALGHRRILVMGPPLVAQQRVTLTSGKVVYPDCVLTNHAPFYLYYSDTIRRYIAEYEIDLRFIAV